MTKTTLPGFGFEQGMAIRRLDRSVFGSSTRVRVDWQVIGLIGDGTPFLLYYSGAGFTQWHAPSHLGDPLRRKILAGLRVEVRRADPPPAWLQVHDLTALGIEEGAKAAEKLTLEYYHDVWQAGYAPEPAPDYVLLAVPFAEKDQAKALGAVWYPEGKTWRVQRREDMSAFAAWLPKEPTT